MSPKDRAGIDEKLVIDTLVSSRRERGELWGHGVMRVVPVDGVGRPMAKESANFCMIGGQTPLRTLRFRYDPARCD